MMQRTLLVAAVINQSDKAAYSATGRGEVCQGMTGAVLN